MQEGFRFPETESILPYLLKLREQLKGLIFLLSLLIHQIQTLKNS